MKSQTSSSSSFTYKWTYDVFISFRGKDTRLGFARYLYKALCGKGINTFIDDEELEPGAEITPALVKAIKESRIALVIFSKNYASSTFCLEELAMIVECSKDKGMLVWPVFYHVDPADVRHQRGSYAEALAKHEERFEKVKIEKWRAVLKNAADRSGSHFRPDGYQYEYDFIENTSQSISQKISNLRDDDKNQQPKPQSSRFKYRRLEHMLDKRVHHNKVDLSHPRAELISYGVSDQSIKEIFSLGEKIEHNSDKYETIKAQEIPEEGKNLGTGDKLIHVYHFKKYRARNQEKIQNFGDPFSLVIHKLEKLADIKLRIQKKLRVPFDEISKWKFACVRFHHAEYLEDLNYPDSVSDRFKSGSTYGDWEQYLGLEHADI